MSGSAKVSEGDYEKFGIGSSVPAVYDPQNEARSTLTFAVGDGNEVPMAYESVMLAIMSICVVYSILTIFRSYNLMQYGSPTKGTLRKIREVSRTKYGVFEYRDETGYSFYAEKAFPVNKMPDYTTVLYDVNNPQRKIVYPFGLFKCAK
jgi:hypothetical protein